jgi:anti-sigma regulatory factor (Ser/Thr protein kinase)
VSQAVRSDAPSSAGLDEWARDALARLASLPSVGRVGLALTEGGGRRLLFVASDRDNEPSLDWCYVDAYSDVPLNAAVRSGELVTGSLDQLASLYPDFVERQPPGSAAALAAAPIRAASQTVGGFVLFYTSAQRFGSVQRGALIAHGTTLGVLLRRSQQARSRTTATLAAEPVPQGAVVATHEVPADLAAVRGARRFLVTALTEWGVDEDATDTAVLCLSEVVTNALMHTRAGCEVRLVLDGGVLTASVRDSGTGVVPTALTPDPLEVHGRGLQVVDTLSARWGSDLDEVGTTVWFVLET